MKQVTQLQAEALRKTHVWFFESMILDRTDKAYRVSVFNSKGAACTPWVPISRLSYVDIHWLNTNDRTTEMRRKYFIPKFFVK